MWGAEQWGLSALGGLMALIASVLYMWGGTTMSWGGKKWLRRFLGSFVLALAASIIAVALAAWDWRYLIMYPCLIGGFSLGYGGDRMWTKVWKRTVFALGTLMACVVGAWIAGWTPSALLVLGLSFVTGLTSVALGVFNPFKNAPLEQYLICQVLTLYVPFWAFVR
jgi:hypothetical protein